MVVVADLHSIEETTIVLGSLSFPSAHPVIMLFPLKHLKLKLADRMLIRQASF